MLYGNNPGRKVGNNIKSFFSLITVFTVLFLSATSVLAHVVVKPETVGVGKFQTFTVGVPNEKEVSVTSLRLIIPKGLNHVSPNVKPGWNIEVKKAGVSMKGEILNTGEKAPDPETITEINWTGGAIPAGQRDEFLFSAQVPASETTLTWMAYQTYADGTVVSWDKDSKGHDEDDPNSGPMSQTKIVKDLNTPPQTAPILDDTKDNLSLAFAVLAIVIAIASFVLQLRKK